MLNKEKLTQEQKARLFAVELQYENALKSGDQAGIKRAKEELDKLKLSYNKSLLSWVLFNPYILV